MQYHSQQGVIASVNACCKCERTRYRHGPPLYTSCLPYFRTRTPKHLNRNLHLRQSQRQLQARAACGCTNHLYQLNMSFRGPQKFQICM
jgi:hypothetical protein